MNLVSLHQVVKDRVCLRALEKMVSQLVDSREQAELLSASALQPLDVNADGNRRLTESRPAENAPQTPPSRRIYTHS